MLPDVGCALKLESSLLHASIAAAPAAAYTFIRIQRPTRTQRTPSFLASSGVRGQMLCLMMFLSTREWARSSEDTRICVVLAGPSVIKRAHVS